MDENAKKIALRMIPFILFGRKDVGNEGRISVATINWVTQTSFQRPVFASTI